MVLVKMLSKNYKCSFRNKSPEKNTELSKYVWKLKEKDINYFINWDIAMILHNMFVDLESVIYAFVRSSLLQEHILMFCSINVMSLSQNAGIEIHLL